jgi:hypothetical protein
MKSMDGSPFESVRSSQLVCLFPLPFGFYNFFFEMPLPRSLIMNPTGRDTRRKETHSALA